jgi:Ca2+-dependent lipid-binding protein
MATCGAYYRTSLRRVRRNFRDDINRELAKTRLESDSETLEWMNSFLVKFWPIYAPNLAESIIASVDQVLSTSTPAFLDSMRLRTFILGTKPPRMEHVKTYPKTEDDIVLMDWKFSFTPTDTMDMTARQLKVKINPKVVLEIRIGKAMISKAMDIIVEDFAFSGLLRVRFKLQLAFPHVEKIDISFIGRPDIDYVCKPLGGETLGFDINFIPGLESFIKEQIHASLAPMMYDPNVFPIEIAKMLSGNPVDLAIGVVAVTIHGAQGLKNPDKFAGTPDPYTVVSLNSRSELGRTKTITQNANPRWNETVYIIITNYTDVLTLQVYDFNEYRKDKELGAASFPLEKLEQIPEHENLQLEVISSGKSRGQVQADVRFFPVLQGQKLDDGTVGPPPESNTGIARITIEQCKELDGSKSLVGHLSPYAVLLLNGKEIHVTKKLKRTNNPIFPEPTKSVLITDRKKARIGVVIKDDRDLATDPIIGSYQIKVDDLISLVQKGQEWFSLSGTKTGRAKLSLDWKPIALQGISGGAGGYVTPIGVMRIHFQNARELRNLETIGKSDPYARVMLSGIEKGRTVTFQNNLNPDWDEVIYVPMHSTNERLVLEVMDTETLGRDRSLGLTEVRASEFIHESEDGGYEVHDAKALVTDDLRMSGKGTPKGKLNYTVAFYPTLNVIDPEEEEEEQKAQAEMENKSPPDSKQTSLDSKPSLDAPKSLENGVGVKPRASLDTKVAPALTNGVKEVGGSTSASMISAKKPPKVRINVEDLSKYRMFVSEMKKNSFANPMVQNLVSLFSTLLKELLPKQTSN